MTETLERVTRKPSSHTVGRPRLGPRAAFALQVSMLVLFLAASSAPSPPAHAHRPRRALSTAPTERARKSDSL